MYPGSHGDVFARRRRDVGHRSPAKIFLAGVGTAAAAVAEATSGVASSLGYSPAVVADNAPIVIGDVDESSDVYAISRGSQSLCQVKRSFVLTRKPVGF